MRSARSACKLWPDNFTRDGHYLIYHSGFQGKTRNVRSPILTQLTFGLVAAFYPLRRCRAFGGLGRLTRESHSCRPTSTRCRFPGPQMHPQLADILRPSWPSVALPCPPAPIFLRFCRLGSLPHPLPINNISPQSQILNPPPPRPPPPPLGTNPFNDSLQLPGAGALVAWASTAWTTRLGWLRAKNSAPSRLSSVPDLMPKHFVPCLRPRPHILDPRPRSSPRSNHDPSPLATDP